ncbi:hypothetical protein TcWFU_010076 [Taenia crassiceps]|uniref:Uncharacterized protein n=1 Tax=Taenia crassiceps TaxID=6207 RepID=A0ABR4Q340_9CEST
MDRSGNDDQQMFSSGQFCFWPQYNEEVEWMEEEDRHPANQRTWHTASRTRSKKKASGGKGVTSQGCPHQQCWRGGREMSRSAGSAKASTSRACTSNALVDANGTRRYSALASRTPLLECSRSTRARLSKSRVNSSVNRLSKAPSKKSSSSPIARPTLPPHPQPQTQLRSHQRAIFRKPWSLNRQWRKVKDAKGHPSACSASPTALQSPNAACAPVSTSKATGSADAQAPNWPTWKAKKPRHLLDFSHFPFGWKFKRLQEEKEGVISPQPEQCFKLPAERVQLTDTSVPLAKPCISYQPCAPKHFTLISQIKSCAAMTLLAHNQMPDFMAIRTNGIHLPLTAINDAKCCNALRVRPREVRLTSEIVQHFSSVLPSLPPHSPQRATHQLHGQRNAAIAHHSAGILFHSSAINLKPPQRNCCPFVPVKPYHPPFPPVAPQPDIPPERTSIPASPYVPVDSGDVGTLGKPALCPIAFGPQRSAKLQTSAPRVDAPPALDPCDTMQRIRKLRSILRVDQWLSSLWAEDGVHV